MVNEPFTNKPVYQLPMPIGILDYSLHAICVIRVIRG